MFKLHEILTVLISYSASGRSEDLRLWLELEEFRTGHDLFGCTECYDERIISHAVDIYTKYIGIGAEYEIRNSAASRRRVEKVLQGYGVKIIAGSRPVTGSPVEPRANITNWKREPSRSMFLEMQTIVSLKYLSCVHLYRSCNLSNGLIELAHSSPFPALLKLRLTQN